MKKRSFFALWLLLLLLSTALPCSAYAETLFGVVYEDSDETDANGNPTIQVIGYHGGYRNLTIPAEIDGKAVTRILPSAFAGNVNVVKVVIPDSVTEIGKEAFANCINLRTVTLPAGLETLPEGCFTGCTLLKNLTLPESLRLIDDFAFQNCIMLGRLRIPASVETIGHDAFMACENLTLDCSDSPLAAAYAAENFLSTADSPPRDRAYHTAIAITAGLGAAVVVFELVRRHRRASLAEEPETSEKEKQKKI